ncbi:uncharacterized protein LOC130048315 isoform X2 [Ostrea edulis]|uniref:uncharacterized protein LOC130048315 isoform X2 n=1 Tax=Ostrea edulis TaxID=37623 RepID=UPI0024AF4E70|nr:uncharacterized protein LOC130048315 isoform X2 [Ostrea edulis]
MVNNGLKICWLKVFFLITTFSLVLADTCPNLSGWDIRASTFCEDDPSKYHCLENQAGQIQEACITPKYIKEGHYPVLSIREDALLERPCPNTHYQPYGQPSNQYKKVPCTYTKGACAGDGEETCDDGDTVSDRMCRCDFTRGYASSEYLLSNPRSKSCYKPKIEVQGCVMLPCENGTELNKAYQCVPICPSGYFRPKFEFDCVPRHITSSQSTSTEPLTSKAVDDQSRQKEAPEMTVYCAWKGRIARIINTCRGHKDDSDDESSDLSETGEGMKLRKHVDDGYPYKEGDVIHKNNLKDRIGCITVELPTGGKEFGTGFRVGERHVLTAYHVVQGVFENLWKTVIRRLKQRRDYVKGISEFGSKSIPDDGKWSLTDLLINLDPPTRETFKSIGKGMISDTCKMSFGYVDDKINGTHFTFSYDAPFISKEHDIAILELLPVSDSVMPDALSLADLYTPTNHLYVLGHPAGRELIIDPSCRILNDEHQLNSAIKKGIKLFTSLGENKSKVEHEYCECKISQNHIFFHCSKNTAHGASGSPLVRIVHDKAEVIGILLKGYPKLYYNKYRQNTKVNKKPSVLIESGVSMEKVKDLLVREHKLVELADIIFK